MYKAVIFDFFGVFCPDITLEWFKKNVSDYESKLSKFQAICSKSDYGKLNKMDFYAEISHLTNIPVEDIIEGVEAEVVLNEELVLWVEKLKHSGYKTACLSNGTHEWTLDMIERHGLARLFDEIVLSGDLGIVKPDPKIYEHTMRLLNVISDESIFVDDRQVNVDAANKLGIKGLLFVTTEQFIPEFQHLTGQHS